MRSEAAREAAARTAFVTRPVPVNVTLPAPVAAAIQGECRRTSRTRTEVIVDLLAWALPRRLADDLAHLRPEDDPSSE